MTRTKQCEVVLKISTDTLRKKGEKSMLNKDKSDNFFLPTYPGLWLQESCRSWLNQHLNPFMIELPVIRKKGVGVRAFWAKRPRTSSILG